MSAVRVCVTLSQVNVDLPPSGPHLWFRLDGRKEIRKKEKVKELPVRTISPLTLLSNLIHKLQVPHFNPARISFTLITLYTLRKYGGIHFFGVFDYVR